MQDLFIFGFGFTARALAGLLNGANWQIAGTARTDDGRCAIEAAGHQGFVFDTGTTPPEVLTSGLAKATHILISVPPGPNGDPVIGVVADCISNMPALKWIGYLSTIGVYGNHNGGWVDETTPATPQSERSVRRLEAEQAWQRLADTHNKTLQIFRLAGIYGPGRSALERIQTGKARAIIKPDQVFNRIHVTDAAAALSRALSGHGQHDIYNLCDDLPSPPQDPLIYAANLLGRAPPPSVAFQEAELSSMAQSFYSENKRVRNNRIKEDLGVSLRFPTYREGLAAIAKDRKATS